MKRDADFDELARYSGEWMRGEGPESDIVISTRIRLAAAMGYAVLLVVMALLPSSSRVVGLSVPDWFAHAIAYGILAGLVYWASLPSLGRSQALLVGVLSASVFGVLTECLQFLQPRRSVEVEDLIANTAGALLVCGIIAGLSRFGPGAKP